jgi:NitT/TauT family transport system ATP-binding protein
MTSKVSIRNVSKVYVSPRTGERIEALRDVSVNVSAHEFLAIVGPSGCGKSTLLSLVAGLNKPTKGGILFDGEPVVGPGKERGVLFQDYALFPWLSVRENVEFGPSACGMPKNRRAETSARFIELVGLKGFENKLPHELSGGMRQRCALARMLANEPEVWLMDEPLAAVDLQTRSLLQEELLKLWGDRDELESRRPVLFITHGIDEAVFLADRIVVLGRRPGRVKEIVKIKIPRPRLEHRHSHQITEYKNYIWELIRLEAEAAIVD